MVAVIFLFVFVFFVHAQDNIVAKSSGAFSEARFEGSFQKYLSRDIFSPFFSWKGAMGIDINIYKKNKSSVYFKSDFQTVGAKKTESKINVAGTSYILEGRYGYQFSQNVYFGAGITHLSSHLTQDLENIVIEQMRKGAVIPEIDSSDLNVIFFEAWKQFASLPLQPEIRARVQPTSFQFRGGRYSYERPIYVDIKIVPWYGNEKKLVFATQHELGDNYFNDYSLRLELFSRGDKEGRFQIFTAYSPGAKLHVSPNVGWHRDGVRAGIKLVFFAH